MCEICHSTIGHDPRCPYYVGSSEREPTGDVCIICGEPICEGDDILCDGDVPFHTDCFYNTPKDKLIDALGFDSKIAGY